MANVGEVLAISDPIHDHRTKSGGSGNGNGGSVRWGLPLVMAIIAGLAAYFSAIGSANERIAVVEARQTAGDTVRQVQFDEIQRSLLRIEQDMRDMKASMAPRGR